MSKALSISTLVAAQSPFLDILDKMNDVTLDVEYLTDAVQTAPEAEREALCPYGFDIEERLTCVSFALNLLNTTLKDLAAATMSSPEATAIMREALKRSHESMKAEMAELNAKVAQ